MRKYIIPITTLLIIYACATVQSPVGGEKDTTAPELIQSTPKHQSLNFKGTELTLLFSEWMKVENLQKELIITPRTNIEYEHLLKKDLLTITLDAPLQDSTTYTFNFRKSLKDITEGNLWQEPILAFSTGNYLDSMLVEGTVLQLKTREPAKDFTVALYDNNYDTANLRQGEPVYFTTTNEYGQYKLQNLKPGKYLLYGFKDANNNLKNEPQAEPYAFYPNALNLYDSLPAVDLYSYKSNEDTLQLKKATASGRDFVLNYNKGIANYRITNILNPGSYVFANEEDQAQKLRIYLNNFRNIQFESDSVPLAVQSQDSIGNTRIDTVYAKFRESSITSEAMKITQMPSKDILTGNQEFKIELNKPAFEIYTDSIYIKYDSVMIQNITRDDIIISPNKKLITITAEINKQKIDSIDNKRKQITDSIASMTKDTTANQDKNAPDKINEDQITTKPTPENPSKRQLGTKEGQQQTQSIRGLHLYIGHGSFVGIENDSTASNKTIFTFKKAENFGIIKGSVKGDTTDFIIELTNAKYEVIDTLYNRQQFVFDYVKPGDYYLRVIVDENGNRLWDPGNALTLKPHEPIIYLDEKITVKANWEIIDKNIILTEDKDVDKE